VPKPGLEMDFKELTKVIEDRIGQQTPRHEYCLLFAAGNAMIQPVQ
jgi:hypothetical protein